MVKKIGVDLPGGSGAAAAAAGTEKAKTEAGSPRLIRDVFDNPVVLDGVSKHLQDKKDLSSFIAINPSAYAVGVRKQRIIKVTSDNFESISHAIRAHYGPEESRKCGHS